MFFDGDVKTYNHFATRIYFGICEKPLRLFVK